MRLLTTVANNGRTHLASAERGAPDEGVPVCGAQSWSLPRTQGQATCVRCIGAWWNARAGGVVATPLPVDHPALALPRRGSEQRLARGVTVGSPFAAAWPTRAIVEVLEVMDYRPHNVPDVLVRVERAALLPELRRAGARLTGMLVDLRDLDGWERAPGASSRGGVFDASTGLPVGLDTDGAMRAVVWRGTGRSSFAEVSA